MNDISDVETGLGGGGWDPFNGTDIPPLELDKDCVPREQRQNVPLLIPNVDSRKLDSILTRLQNIDLELWYLRHTLTDMIQSWGLHLVDNNSNSM